MLTRSKAQSTTREKSVSRRSISASKTDIPVPAPGSPAAELASKPGLRVRPYRPMRALVGALIVVAAVIAALAIYTRVGNRTEVLAVTRPILAGEQIIDADLQVVSISSDDSFPSIPASNRAIVVGQYAKVRLAAGSLLVNDSIQPEQLVNPDRVLMSVVVPVGLIPVGLREQSRLTLVVTPQLSGGDDPRPVLVEATVAAVPRNLAEIVGTDDSGRSMVALSIEIEPQWVSLVGSASAVSVGVLNPAAPFPGNDAQAFPTENADGQTVVPTAPAAPTAPTTPLGASDDESLYGATTVPAADAAAPTTAAVDGTQPAEPTG